MPFAIFMLTLAGFGIGTSEYVIMGLLPDIARDLNVTIPEAGTLVSMYAMGVVVGAPLLAILTMKISRKITLLGLMIMFIVGNILCALSPNYKFLMAARVLAALCHGTFFGIASVVAAGMVKENKRAEAISLVFMGVSLANILGVPIGTYIGHNWGWRSTFWAVSAMGVVSVFALIKSLSSDIPMPEGNVVSEFRALKHRRVILPLLISVTTSASLFIIFTYIAPILEGVTNVSPSMVVNILFLIGLGLTIGTFIGGKLGDRSLIISLITLMILLIIIQTSMVFASIKVFPMIMTLLGWSIASFALCPMLQLAVVLESKEAPNLASTFNQSSFNLGNAIGAKIGGSLIYAGVALRHLSIFSAIVMLIAIALTLYFKHLVKHQTIAE